MKIMLQQLLFLALFPLLFTSCGGGGPQFSDNVPTQSIPIVERLDPTTLSRGDTLSIFGFGYSFVPAENVITIGSASAVAESYTLINDPNPGEIEEITVTVPNTTPIGENTVFIIIGENASNSNLTITVQP